MKRCSSKHGFHAPLALILVVSMWRGLSPASAEQAQCNIVLITIDTLRADHVSCYGYARKTSPAIDSLAEGGIVCNNAYAPSSWTAPSMASLFTSVYPINHGVIHGIGYVKDKTIHVQEVFSPDLTTLAEVLHANGYTTFGVASNPHLDEQFGFARGFDYFTCFSFGDAHAVNEAVYTWEENIKEAKKFFLWVHYIDPHYPYSAQKPWIDLYATQKQAELLRNIPLEAWWEPRNLTHKYQEDPMIFSTLIALYDSEINYVDAHMGELIERFNLHEDTLIVITSDHGEEFLEHGETGHGRNLYQQTIHIPLIIKLPHSFKRTVVKQSLSLIDVMPAILQIINVQPPAETLGKAFLKKNRLFSWLKEEVVGIDAANYIYAELDTTANLKTILSLPWKYIYNYRDKTDQLYDIMSDPLELNNLAGEETREFNKLKKQLLHWVETSKRYTANKYDFTLSQEEKDKLKGLGYLQ